MFYVLCSRKRLIKEKFSIPKDKAYRWTMNNKNTSPFSILFSQRDLAMSQLIAKKQISYVSPFMLGDIYTSVVWTYYNFDNFSRIKQNFTKYLKESFCLSTNQHFFFNFFFKKCSGHLHFFKIVRAFLVATGMNGFKEEINKETLSV